MEMRQKMFNVLISVYFYIIGTVLAISFMPVAFIIWLITVGFDRNLKCIHFFTSFWGGLFPWLNPFWRVKILDSHKFKRDDIYVVVSNHQSMVDIMVLFRLFRFFKWVSKSENFKTPIIGWVMHLNRYIRIRRGDAKSATKMIRDCEDVLRKGSSIMIFPEGTRSETSNMRRFKDGAFHIAKDAGVKILPIVLDGSGRAMPKKGLVLEGRQNITVKILDPISRDSVNDLDIKGLRELVYSTMDKELKILQKDETESQSILC